MVKWLQRAKYLLPSFQVILFCCTTCTRLADGSFSFLDHVPVEERNVKERGEREKSKRKEREKMEKRWEPPNHPGTAVAPAWQAVRVQSRQSGPVLL